MSLVLSIGLDPDVKDERRLETTPLVCVSGHPKQAEALLLCRPDIEAKTNDGRDDLGHLQQSESISNSTQIHIPKDN